MRKVIVSEFLTLDGMMSDPKDEMEWVLNTFNEEMGQEIRAQQQETETILLGRITYEIMASYWPTADPATEDPKMIEHMNNTPKIVFSKTLQKTVWSNTKVMHTISTEEINKMKLQPGKNIVVIGSASVAQTLTNLGLVDEYQLLLHPVVLGSGKFLFANLQERRKLRLLEHKILSNGVLSLRYAPVS